ncbi:MAG: hypothetical protein R2880_01430 [Deinococcales bacterium]
MEIFGVLLALAAILIFIYRLSQNRQRASKQLENQLLNLCRNDKEKMERLIHFEQQKAPELGRQQAIARAISSYQRDNR